MTGPWFAALDEMDKVLKSEETEGWRTPAKSTELQLSLRRRAVVTCCAARASRTVRGESLE